MTRKGFGFFAVGEGKDDLFIPPEWTNHALSGDVVKVEPIGVYHDPSGRMPPREAGKVVEIISRAKERFVGTLVEENGLTLLAPDYKKMHVPIVIIDRGNAQIGDKVLVRLGEWAADKEYPLGSIEEIIGKAGVHETEMRALALGQGFSPDFPPGVVADATYLEEHGSEMLARETENQKRRDFRKIPTFTIDPADAKDFDDALSVIRLPDSGIQVGVHIADVSFFVRPGSALDTEAQERATSVYLVDRTIPMLPHVLSTDLCSLNPGRDRLAVSAVFTLDKDADVRDVWFGETVIHSDKRFTYEEAQSVLDAAKDGPMLKELQILLDLSKKIRAKRQAKGAIEFDTAEVKVELDVEGKPIAIHLKERQATNLLIEDFMLLANEAVAKHLADLTNNGGPHFASLYRIHDVPDADRIETLAQLLRVMGYQLKTSGGRVSGAALNALLESVKGKPEEYLVKTATLRSMSKASYATQNIGHFGLAFDYYTHFTSPIRRYPDLVVHRLVKAHAGGELITQEEMRAFDALALHASEREVAAADAERDSIKMKQVEFLAGRIGDTFDAVISGVTERGLYVEEKETHADGMIRITDVGDDYFEYDEKHYRLVGRRTHKAYQLGDPIRVKLVAARIAEKELDFVPA